MKERPIVFTGEMVRAILAGRKTQTRRVLKRQPIMRAGALEFCYGGFEVAVLPQDMPPLCRYGQPGDLLWVKEAFGIPYRLRKGEIAPIEDVVYRANPRDRSAPLNWKPSIFMRREYSRITLKILKVRVERVQDITHRDALAEGFEPCHYGNRCDCEFARSDYMTLWDSTNGKTHPWKSNPWVWVIEFKPL